jgi:hypothetical protein
MWAHPPPSIITKESDMLRSLRNIALAGLLGLAAPVLATTAAVAAPMGTTPSVVVTAKVAAASSSNAKHITIPKTYQYHPHRGPDIALHDYCTASPDEFPTVGKNANFRGPCARHDMCIQYYQHKRSTCDSNLLGNMQSECRYTYKHWYDPRKSACLSTAFVYWAVVRTKTVFS